MDALLVDITDQKGPPRGPDPPEEHWSAIDRATSKRSMFSGDCAMRSVA
jgi:hypothetical protein